MLNSRKEEDEPDREVHCAFSFITQNCRGSACLDPGCSPHGTSPETFGKRFNHGSPKIGSSQSHR